MKKVGQVIEAAITDAGSTLYCVIADESTSEGIDDEIIAQIRQSRFLVADLTDEGGPGSPKCILRSWFCMRSGVTGNLYLQREAV